MLHCSHGVQYYKLWQVVSSRSPWSDKIKLVLHSVVPSVSRNKFWVLDNHSHHQLPAQLFRRVCEVSEWWSHEGGPEDNGQVAGVHLVPLVLQLNLVQMIHEEPQGAEVRMRHVAQDLVHSCALGVRV